MENEKKNIIRRVLALYMKYGIKSVTMDDIARELALSKKTLYQYFTDKNELVSEVFNFAEEYRNECMKDVFGKKMNAIEETLAINMHVAKMMRDFNPAVDYDLRKYYPEIYEKNRDAIIRNMYQKQLANIKKGIEEGLYRSEVNPDHIARLFILRIVNFHGVPGFESTDLLKPEFFREIFVYHIRGLASEKGLKVLEKELKKIENQL